jgi:hypothetical protein
MISFKQFIEEDKRYKAQEGESEVLHHLSPNKFDPNDFRPLSHFGTAAASRDLIGQRRDFLAQYPDPNGGPNYDDVHHHAIRIKLGKVVHLPDVEGADHTPNVLSHLLHDEGHITPEQHKEHLNLKRDLKFDHIANTLRKNGIHTLSYTNTSEDPGSKSYMITDKSQVRPLRSSKGSAMINPSKTSSFK